MSPERRYVERQAEADDALIRHTKRQMDRVARLIARRAERCHSDEARSALDLMRDQISDVGWPDFGEIEGELLRDLPATLADERREAAI